MKQLLYLVILLCPVLSVAQNRITISGYITDVNSGERLIGATAFHASQKQGTVSNNYGFFSINGKQGNNQLQFRFVGYQTKVLSLNLYSDTLITIELQKGINLKEVQVTAQPGTKSNPEISALSNPNISMQMVESTPVIFGEPDVLKTLQFLPGIKQSAENAAGFNVRGGSNDQNLILLDGVPVYNVNHLFGFFSVFNPDAIKNVSLFKGGIPARYGGRLSSVMDISMKEGNLRKSNTTFSISPIAGRITHEAPLKTDKGAYIISLRRTFIDLPWMALQKLNGTKGAHGYYFYDLNAKTNWIVNPKNRLYLSLYTGKDVQFINTPKTDDWDKTKYRYRWGNITSAFRWNKTFSSNLFANTMIYYSKFNHNELSKSGKGEEEVTYKNTTKLNDLCVKTDFDFYTGKNYTIRWGGLLSLLAFSPNIIQGKSTQLDTTFNQTNNTDAKQAVFYIENSINTNKLSMNFGLRYSGYFTSAKNYLSFQPRIAINYRFIPNYSISASYTKMVQNIHLLTNSSLGMPTDLWVASTDRIGPEFATQFSLGLSHELKNNISFGVEAYYKLMDDVVRFEEGASFTNPKQSDWEDNALVGKGKAYGIEMETKKEKGHFTGIFSYTLSWSERKFSELNNGNWFPFKYDRRHDVSILAEYKFKEAYNTLKSISVGFTFQSGNNISLPDFEYQGIPTPGTDYSDDTSMPWIYIRQTYENPNNFKMPVFHHLDIGYNIIKKKTERKTITWSFSVYNVYNRMNPWYYYKTKNGAMKQVSLFPFFPSVGFKYNF